MKIVGARAGWLVWPAVACDDEGIVVVSPLPAASELSTGGRASSERPAQSQISDLSSTQLIIISFRSISDDG